MTIARRFNAGFEVGEPEVPKGRLKRTTSTVPSGLSRSLTLVPALKRRAIIKPSLRDDNAQTLVWCPLNPWAFVALKLDCGKAREGRIGRLECPVHLSTVIHKYDDVCCVAFGLGLGATKEHTRQRSVTEEQQRPKPNATQPSGRQVLLTQTSLLAPYRPLAGMLVARA